MRTKVWVGTALSALMPVGLAVASPPAGAQATGAVRYVSGSGLAGKDLSCGTAGYRTVDAALKTAPAGATVVVCPGTYRTDALVARRVDLIGIDATIDASGKANGITVTASGALVEGFTVRNANGEGILVMGSAKTTVEDVTIRGNTVVHNDLGAHMAKYAGYKECQPSGNVPGDCGEGLHLMGVIRSTVEGNTVRGNSGGILLTDETGPTAGNLITDNVVTGNTEDCGITIASHNPKAFVKGKIAPENGGVFKNRIEDNLLSGNGVRGAGAGVILGVPFPGTAVYDNVISGNRIFGNGQAGVTLHSHAPGQYANGNRIVDNLIGVNNVKGDPDFTPADMATTGVLVRSAVAPVSVTISGNHIVGDAYGLWLSPNVKAAGITANQFPHVTTWLHRA